MPIVTKQYNRHFLSVKNLRPVNCARPSESGAYTASDNALRGKGSGHARLVTHTILY